MRRKELPGGEPAPIKAERETWSSVCDVLGLTNMSGCDNTPTSEDPSNEDILNMSDAELLALAQRQFGDEVLCDYAALARTDPAPETPAPANRNAGLNVAAAVFIGAVFTLGFLAGTVMDLHGDHAVAESPPVSEPVTDGYHNAAIPPTAMPPVQTVTPSQPVVVTTRVEFSAIYDGTVRVSHVSQSVDLSGIGHTVSGQRPRPRPETAIVTGSTEGGQVDREYMLPIEVFGQEIPNLDALIIQAEAQASDLPEILY